MARLPVMSSAARSHASPPIWILPTLRTISRPKGSRRASRERPLSACWPAPARAESDVSKGTSKTVPAVHGLRVIEPDPPFELEFAEYLRRHNEPRGLMEL